MTSVFKITRKHDNHSFKSSCRESLGHAHTKNAIEGNTVISHVKTHLLLQFHTVYQAEQNNPGIGYKT